jgi:hypothetical protein
MTARKVLAEMVRQEAAAGRLTWRRRRALVRFAEMLGLDADEARLLVRAAELGLGAKALPEHADVAREYLAKTEDAAAPWRWVVSAVLVLLINYLGLLWLLKRGG